MDRDAARGPRGGTLVLLAAALVAVLAVAYGIWRQRAAEPAPAAQATASAGTLSIDALEAKVRADPQDGTAWGSLGLAYFSQGRFADSVRAYERATALAPGKAILWAALGEAHVMASERDPMPAAAVAAFEKALALNAGDERSRYFLAVKRDLAGDHAGAIGDWLALLEDSPADAPWRSDLVRTIEQVGKINGIDVAARIAAASARSPAAAAPLATRAIPGPDAQDLRAASAIPPSRQRDMAEGMVARLEARLEQQPGNVEGWIMLIRSRMTLGEEEKAKAALGAAVAANPARAAELREQAALLGVR